MSYYNMKRYFLIIGLIIVTLASCKKSSTTVDATTQAATDDALIKAYISANNITAIKDPSGLYYHILTPGSGAHPTTSSTVTVNYTGKLLNGSVFDSGSGFSSPLGNLIKGWQIGIPYTNVGGRILLIIPSGLGYGSSAAGSIPPNSVLVFTIDLLGFTN